MPLGNFIDEARRLVDAARARGITLRIMGATAFMIHSSRFSHLQESLAREISDIDFMSYSAQRDKIVDFFLKMGYQFDRRRLMIMRYFNRYIFDDPENKRVSDVFFDRLEMCHTIDFKDRLEIDYPTVPLADLLLEKLQIVQIMEKDVKDCVILLREHEVGNKDQETVNAEYISELLSKDWGFYYTSTTNLEKIKTSVQDHNVLQEADKADVVSKISRLQEEIERAPKSARWKMRAKIGPKQKWYRDVEEVERS